MKELFDHNFNEMEIPFKNKFKIERILRLIPITNSFSAYLWDLFMSILVLGLLF